MKQHDRKRPKRSVLIVVGIAAILAAIFGSMLLRQHRQNPVEAAKSLTISYSPFEHAALLWIAEDQHFFSGNGLNVTMRKYDTGVGSLDGMLKGEADITVGVTEFPMVGRAFKKAGVRVISTVAKLEQIYLVGRKDRGIENISDLKGKKVGTTLRTIAHFYLGRFLELHGMTMQDIQLVEVKTPEEWVNAVADGEIDAIATAQPYVHLAKERLGTNAVVWPAQGSQPVFGLVVATDDWITGHPELVGRLLKSLAQAEEYTIRHPVESKAIVRKRLNQAGPHLEAGWSQNQYSLSLDQSLILAMEDEARWMIKNNLTDEKTVPDFLDFIYVDGLEAIRPESVNIIR